MDRKSLKKSVKDKINEVQYSHINEKDSSLQKRLIIKLNNSFWLKLKGFALRDKTKLTKIVAHFLYDLYYGNQHLDRWYTDNFLMCYHSPNKEVLKNLKSLKKLKEQRKKQYDVFLKKRDIDERRENNKISKRTFKIQKEVIDIILDEEDALLDEEIEELYDIIGAENEL